MTPRFLSPRPLLLGWAVSFLVFGVFALVLAAQFLSGDAADRAEILRFSVRDWLPWAVMAPPIFLLSRRFPLESGVRARRLPGYVSGAVLAVGLCAAWSSLVMPMRMHPEEFVSDDGRDFHDDGERPGNPHGRRHGPDGPRPLMVAAWGLPIYLAILGLAHAAHHDRRAKERELRAAAMEAGLARARLEALRMQLQPHFLFNSLNAVAELTHVDPDRADAMIVALAAFLRLTLDTTGEQELPLAREMDFTDLYLRIEQVRFGDRLAVSREIGPETRAAIVPSFILQPLVENAVRHGLSPRSQVTCVRIASALEGDTLVLSVSDNGKGLPPGAPLREGVGLSNIRARLAALYGAGASLTFRNLDGFVAEIRIPHRA